MGHPGSRRAFLSGAFALPALSQAIQSQTTPYNRPKLKITDVRTAQVCGHGLQLHVRIYTDQGSFGHGEGTGAVGGGAPIVRSFRNALIGQDPLNVDRLHERTRTGGIFAGAQVRGARGAILHGSTRDKVELEAMAGFPVLAVGFDRRPATQIGVDWNVPIRVGPAVVLPGDVVVADSEAALFFPAEIVDEVIKRATGLTLREDYERDLVRQKKLRFRDVYPLNPELRQQYEERKKKQQ